MTAKQHIAEAEKDAKECSEHIRAALIKSKFKPTIENMALSWMLTDILEKQITTLRNIRQLLA